MGKVEKLNELFEKWKKEQEEEVDVNDKENQSTIPSLKVSKDSFTYDGFVFDEKDNTVLYMLAESNLDGKIKDNETFWLKSVYKIRNNNLKITKRIEQMQEYLCNKIPELSMKDISYMNINKRGGFAECNKQTLYNYYNKYKDNILREIEIITPQVIVFCAGNKSIYDDLKKNVNCKYIIDMYHPSYQYVSDEKYIEKFKEEFEKLLEK